MSTIHRVRVPWTGGVGGNGVSTFYFLDAAVGLVPLRTFFDALKGNVPSGIVWTFYGEGDAIESTTGVITGSWTGTGQTQVVTSGTGNYSAPAGYQVSWKTGAVYFGHRITGRTFIVPSVTGAMDSNGTVQGSTITATSAAAAALIAYTPGNMLIWSRPKVATPQWTDVQGRVHAAQEAHDGYAVAVNAASVPDKAVVLRSRRD